MGVVARDRLMGWHRLYLRMVAESTPRTIASAEAALSESARKSWRRVLPCIGPAFIACVAYIDPGNFATNISAGAQFGYNLLWVVVYSNILAMLIQALSAKLGIATGKNLPEVISERF